MRWLLIRDALVLALLLEPTRCGVPPMNAQAAEFAPTIIIAEGTTSQGVPYLFGGVSSNERDVMEKRAKGYNVKLVFAEKNGPYLSGVTVQVANVKGAEIFSAATEGPWLYLQLAPGRYSVKAIFKGQTKQIKELRVPKDKIVQQTLVWDLGKLPEP